MRLKRRATGGGAVGPCSDISAAAWPSTYNVSLWFKSLKLDDVEVDYTYHGKVTRCDVGLAGSTRLCPFPSHRAARTRAVTTTHL